jgi:hypothetical protein
VSFLGGYCTNFSKRFGPDSRRNAKLVFEWSRQALKGLDETREDARHV